MIFNLGSVIGSLVSLLKAAHIIVTKQVLTLEPDTSCSKHTLNI